MKLNITPGPWELTTIPFELRNTDSAASIYGKYENGGSPLIADISRSAGDDKDNATAIVTAVNNTYHKGINPEAVPEMLEALKIAKSYIDVFILRGEDPLVGENIKTHSFMIIEALQKATL